MRGSSNPLAQFPEASVLKKQLPDRASRLGFFFNETTDISRHPFIYDRKVGQVVFAVGQVEIQTSCRTVRAKREKHLTSPEMCLKNPLEMN